MTETKQIFILDYFGSKPLEFHMEEKDGRTFLVNENDQSVVHDIFKMADESGTSEIRLCVPKNEWTKKILGSFRVDRREIHGETLRAHLLEWVTMKARIFLLEKNVKIIINANMEKVMENEAVKTMRDRIIELEERPEFRTDGIATQTYEFHYGKETDFVLTAGGIEPLPLKFGYDIQRNKTPTLWLVNKSVEEEVSAYDMIKRIADSVDQTPINICLPTKVIGKYETVGNEVLGSFYVTSNEIKGNRLHLVLWEWAVKTAEIHTLKKKLEHATHNKNEIDRLQRQCKEHKKSVTYLEKKNREYIEERYEYEEEICSLKSDNAKMREAWLKIQKERDDLVEIKEGLEDTIEELERSHYKLKLDFEQQRDRSIAYLEGKEKEQLEKFAEENRRLTLENGTLKDKVLDQVKEISELKAGQEKYRKLKESVDKFVGEHWEYPE